MIKAKILLAVLFLSAAASAIQRTTVFPNGSPSSAYLNLNKISTVFEDNGLSDNSPSAIDGRFFYPKETEKVLVFRSGLIWAAIVDSTLGNVKIGGSKGRTGLQSGWIDSAGNAIPSDNPRSRIYRIRPDVFPDGPPVDLSVEAKDEGKTELEIRTQYETDWQEWPADLGAPFKDQNDNGIYDPLVDIPGVAGAAQTIWFVANDQVDSANWCSSSPLGIEMQATIWEYKNINPGFDNFLFRKYKLINKTDVLGDPKTFEEMYVTMWSDIDVGDIDDDFAGCDTALNLGFIYNANDNDSVYSPLPPPAAGFDLIRGPLVSGNPGEDRNRNGIDDQNDFGLSENNTRVEGFINLPMTAFYFSYPFVDVFPDNPPNCGSRYKKIEQYHLMSGRVPFTGELWINPKTGLPTTFVNSGDPVTGEGWLDGFYVEPDDRDIGLSTGPFQMAPGDTQVIVIAEIAAGAVPGVTRLMAIDSLRHYSAIAQNFYDEGRTTSISDNKKTLPGNFHLFQNYPNPFNPSTVISWELAVGSQVTLKVYDILGNEVAVLVDKEQSAGNYEVEFDIEGLSSGVYFYQLSTERFMQTKKMILLR